MKSFSLRFLIMLAVAGLALASASAAELNPNIERKIGRLTELLQLSSDQTAKASEIFTQEHAALQAYASTEERLQNGMAIRQGARAQIRALLTPTQQKIYDSTPQRLGGGAMHDVAGKASRLDKVVTLTDEQTLQIAAIYQQEADALQALSPEERSTSKGAMIRQAAKTRARAILTPEQQQKHDANPTGAEDLEERAHVVMFLKTSPQVAARLGAVSRVSPEAATVSATSVNEQVQSLKGTNTYSVQGAAKTETLKVFWERSSRSGPIKILQVQTPTGQLLAL